ncbi:MAG: hypothetical protein ACKOZW_10785 [Cyanobium sp.]
MPFDAMMPERWHQDAMRTTLTIDDDLLRQLRQKALDSGTPFKQVVNTMLRAGLRRSEVVATEPAAYRLPTFSIGALAPGVDLTKATALAAALEDEARLEKMRHGQ